MRRRAVLALAGVLLATGCSGGAPRPETPRASGDVPRAVATPQSLPPSLQAQLVTPSPSPAPSADPTCGPVRTQLAVDGHRVPDRRRLTVRQDQTITLLVSGTCTSSVGGDPQNQRVLGYGPALRHNRLFIAKRPGVSRLVLSMAMCRAPDGATAMPCVGGIHFIRTVTVRVLPPRR